MASRTGYSVAMFSELYIILIEVSIIKTIRYNCKIQKDRYAIIQRFGHKEVDYGE